MNFLKLSIISVISLFKLIQSEEEGNKFCETKTFDYAFSFIDKDQFPNGIMIKKDDFIVIFNDDFDKRSFTEASHLMKIHRQNNYTGGLGIKYAPKCGQKEEEYCIWIRKFALGAQLVITKSDTNEKSVQGFVNNKLRTQEDLEGLYSKENRHKAVLFPKSSDWSEETDLFTFRTQNFELIFVSNSVKKIFWISLRDLIAAWEVLKKMEHRSIDFSSDLSFFSVFELKGQIYLVHNREAPVIYTLDISRMTAKRKLKERADLSLYTLFEGPTLCPKHETPFSVTLAKFLANLFNWTMVSIAIIFVTFFVFYNVRRCIVKGTCCKKKEKGPLTKPNSPAKAVPAKPKITTRTDTQESNTKTDDLD